MLWSASKQICSSCRRPGRTGGIKPRRAACASGLPERQDTRLGLRRIRPSLRRCFKLWRRSPPNISLHPTVLSPLRAAKTAAELHR